MPVIPNWYLGIDPGQSGGIALVSSDKNAWAVKMPDTEANIWDVICEYCDRASMALIEKVHSMPKQGVASSFKFGGGYGGLRMAMVAAGIPFDEVTPQKWQKALGIVARNTKTESKSDHKKKMLAKAQQLFPGIKVTLATADALLIAEYCRRVYA